MTSVIIVGIGCPSGPAVVEVSRLMAVITTTEEMGALDSGGGFEG